jgi:molybdopterin converting factor subunit 1
LFSFLRVVAKSPPKPLKLKFSRLIFPAFAAKKVLRKFVSKLARFSILIGETCGQLYLGVGLGRLLFSFFAVLRDICWHFTCSSAVDFMKLNCLFFARGRELVGKESFEFEVPDNTTVEQFCQNLITTFPQLQNLSFVLAVNQEYTDPSSTLVLPPNCEIAVIPPVSGG